jgi:hypothetical protein
MSEVRPPPVSFFSGLSEPAALLKENSADPTAIHYSEGSPGTEQHPKNGLFHDTREDMISSGPPVE